MLILGNKMTIQTIDKKILYPLFSECSQFTLDSYWKQIFEECARGRFPRGSTIDAKRNVINFRTKSGNTNNYFSYSIKKHDPQKTFKDLKELFQTKLSLQSHIDHQKIRAEFDDICQDLQETYTGNWTTIKGKKVRDAFVRRYILDLKEKYKLNDRETADVARTIKLGFLLNWIGSDQVVYENQRILDIKALYFNPKERIFELEETNGNVKREYKPQLQKLSALWENHLKRPRNKYIL